MPDIRICLFGVEHNLKILKDESRCVKATHRAPPLAGRATLKSDIKVTAISNSGTINIYHEHDAQAANANGGFGGGSKLKKRGSWLKSIKNVASSVTGHKERRSSDERDTSSEKGGRRSSSATDDSQDISFHGPERIRVRQYGKSVKDLTALYKSQEIQAHNGSIWTIKFSLDGKYLASAGEDCVIHVWQISESERKGDLLLDKLEDGNLNLLFLANGSPEPSSMSPNLDSHSEKKRRGRSSISRKSVSFEQILVPETMFALLETHLFISGTSG
ncbi:WD repeat-containing protein 44 [Forsythia ovata]|uniref:WD repeat-containing protein 44 n=1 Tax=Forsythia ovata TaxID=205694 RepID=A0ABD1T789_9LAMI